MDGLSFKLTDMFKRINEGEKISKEETEQINKKIKRTAKKNIGDNIANYSNRAGISYDNIAKMLGYSSHSAISNISNENQLPSLEVLIKLSVLTNKSLDELVFKSSLSTSKSVMDELIDMHQQDIEFTKKELYNYIEIIYEILRKHNIGALFYVPDEYSKVLKSTIEENEFLSDISLRVHKIIEIWEQNGTIYKLKAAKNIKEFKQLLTQKQLKEIENIIPKKRDRNIFNDYIQQLIYDIITS